MKPAAIVADEMFPEGAGPYMDIEEVCKLNLMLNYQSYFIILFYDLKKKNRLAADRSSPVLKSSDGGPSPIPSF